MNQEVTRFVKKYYPILIFSIGTMGILTYLLWAKRRENLDYLDVYDSQDRYKNRPAGTRGWPVVNTYTTAEANVLREQIARDKGEYDSSPELNKNVYNMITTFIGKSGARY
jgi:hypothetical protein